MRTSNINQVMWIAINILYNINIWFGLGEQKTSTFKNDG